MKGHLRLSESGRSYIVIFGRIGGPTSLYKSFSPDEYGSTAKALAAAKKWHKENQDWVEGRQTANSIKVDKHLEKLKKGSKLHIGSTAKELGVGYAVVHDRLKKKFKGRFEVLEGENPWYDRKTRLPYTKDGIRFEPKLFQYYDKDGKVQNRGLWQTQSTKGGATVGEWNVLTEGRKGGKTWDKIYKFPTKAAALKFREDYKIKTSGEVGKLRRYLDAEIAKSGGKKLSFASAKDLKTKANSKILDSEVWATLNENPKYKNKVNPFPLRQAYTKPFTKVQKQSLMDAFSGEVKKWDFKNYKYGINPTSDRKLYKRMESFFRYQDTPWRYKFNFQAPGGWMIQQMDRAAAYGNPKYKPILNKAGKVIGMKDEGISYYISRKIAPSNASKLISSHPHFEQVQKIVDIAAKAKAPLTSQADKASKALVTLFPKGFDASALSLSRLIGYLNEHKGPVATKNAIQLHHIKPLKSLGDATNPKNIMPLRRDLNTLANTIDQQVRKGDLSRIPELKEARVKINVGDTLYGRGTRDATKLLRQETEALYEPLSKFKTKDWGNLQTWLKQNLKRAVKSAPGSCQAILSKQTGGIAKTCVEAINRDPIGSANKLANMEATSGALGKVKNAATGFLGMLGRGGVKAAPLAAVAALGAVAEPLVKQFRNDDPTTYMTDENQQKGVLLSLVEAETPQVDEEILKWQHPGQIAGAAAAIPGSGAMMKARKAKGFGLPRQALGPVGKVLAGSFSPLGVAASLPISLAAQVKGGSEIEDIATDPFNWMGPAFASTGAKMATRGMPKAGILSKALKMGMSPGALRVLSRGGIYGLLASAGLKGYDIWENSKYK